MIVVSDVGAKALDVACRVGLDLAVSEEGEPVTVSISDVVVFESGFLDRLEEVDCLRLGASRPT